MGRADIAIIPLMKMVSDMPKTQLFRPFYVIIKGCYGFVLTKEISGMNLNIEDILSRAIENGDFDNLSGMGKPLNLREDVHSNPTLRMAHRIMKEHGTSPAWISQRKEIQAKRDAALNKLARAWQWRQTANPIEHPNVEQYWQRVCRSVTTTLTTLNKQIFDFNLSTQITSQHLRPIDIEHEIRKITGE